jgi:hypothetical protein
MGFRDGLISKIEAIADPATLSAMEEELVG